MSAACAWASCVKTERNKQAAFPLVVCLAVRECVTTLCSASVSSHLLLASFFSPTARMRAYLFIWVCAFFSLLLCACAFSTFEAFRCLSQIFFFCIISHCVPVCGCSVLSPFVYICVSAYGSTWCFSALNAAWHFLFLCVCTYSGVHSVCKVFS